jgi:large subunit ribosomal protein L3
MAGQMGNVKRTIQNLEIVRVDTDRNLLLVKGAVPGSKGGDVIIRASVKARTGEKSS